MNCTQCHKSNSQQISFLFKHRGEKVELVAHSCRACGALFAEDRALLRAARKHLRLLTNDSNTGRE